MKLAGAEHLFRIRVGDYRFIYGIDSEQRIVVIHYVCHRSEAYRDVLVEPEIEIDLVYDLSKPPGNRTGRAAGSPPF